MVDKLHIPPQGFIPPIQPAGGSSRGAKPAQVVGTPFQEILLDQVAVRNRISFSAHAKQRISDRGIDLTPDDIDRIGDGINRAAQKGAKDSLVMLRDLAFVVSVNNRKVVTAVDQQNLRDNVFTNIDSAVFV
jgi:flagellar operon protein